ncbi:MAG: winged helix-turn-helix transcriptional regulator [Candidatus Lokiarchaeota archaeon]|nr:winged helix-turn-helix transcriptional regulator [Candidatus Lokiarchaeota archaeon]MBD3340941.1 winged helix-turn-helix transcriptional regulator [Candidatus Lokiarchaeota archaeon]
MDEIDIKIITFLILNSRLTYRELSNHLDLSLNAVYKRLQNLIEMGIIKKFSATINAHALGAIFVFIFGKSNAQDMNKVIADLRQNKRTATLIITSRNYLYVGAFLRDVHELGDYGSFVSRIAELQSPVIGLRDGSYYSSPVQFIYPKSSTLNIDKLDLAIIRTMHNDSRKSISEIADDVNSTPNTVRRRLKRLVNEGLIELTIEFFLEESSDFFSLVLINLRTGIDRIQAAKKISEKYQPFVLFCWTFSNLPNTLLCWVWSNNIKQLNDLLDGLKNEDTESVVTDIIRKGFFLDTWIDELIYKEKI